MTTLDIYLRPGVYSRPGIYFWNDAVYPQQLNGTRRLYETGRNLRQYAILCPVVLLVLFSCITPESEESRLTVIWGRQGCETVQVYQ